MKWEQEALEIIDQIPLPPVMDKLARLDAERRAMQRGLDTVTAAVAKAVEKGYARVFGKEATETIRRMRRGESIELPDEFFEEDDGELFKIEICPAKFGACTAEKRDMILKIIAPLRSRLKELNTTQAILEKARTPLMSHHMLHVSIIGCPNCCLSPYFSDFGIICTYSPAVRETGCVQCEACVRYCREGAIAIQNGLPVIDYTRCVKCGGCVKECGKDALFIEKSGYKVVAGGSGSRHPHIARTVAEFTDAAGVLGILERALQLFKETPVDKQDVSFHGVIGNADAAQGRKPSHGPG